MRRLWLVGGVLWLGACVTTPAGPSPAAPPTTSPLTPAADPDVAPVTLELTELSVRIEADGSSVRTLRERYRLLSAEPGERWTHVYAFWRPWTDDGPSVDATVITPDGATLRLDPKTVSDQAFRNDAELLTDEKLRIAPLPALALGAVVERTSTTRHRPFLVSGAAFNFHLEVPAPEKKRVLLINVPAGAPLHLEALDTDAVMTRTEKNGRVLVRYERGPARPSEGDAPGAPPRYGPLVRASTVASWQAAAAAWASRVEPQVDVAAVRALATTVVAGQTSREGKVQALLAWLRKNVRYTGLELDEAAWVPRRSAEVLERKYGDCKDLSVLLVAMLRAVKLEADPALLNAGDQRDTTPATPGLHTFNHAIVRIGGGPTLWVDPTAPWTALGELPPAVVGRNALVARPDVTALEPVTSAGLSTLDTRFDWFLSPSGPVRLERKRKSEGWAFGEARGIAAASQDQYRKNLEGWARDSHGSKGAVSVDISEPAAAGPFVESLVVPDSNWGVSDPGGARAFVAHDHSMGGLRFLLELEKRLEDREAPVVFRMPSRARVLNVFHPPVGYRLKELPPAVQETVGPATFSLTWRFVDEALEAALEVELKAGAMSAADARRFVDEVYPRLDAQVVFPNVVLTAIDEGRFHTAATEAEALLAKQASPALRSLLGYALSASGLQTDAELQVRKAVAEAPRDPVVRNRLAFVLLHNDRGIEFGRGYRRAEVLSVLEASLALDPDNEWTRRMHALVLLTDEHGDFVREPAALAKLDAELSEYRAKTKGTTLDDEAIDVMLRRKDWARLAVELPKFPQTTQRDAAWLAAELVTRGVEASFQRAAQERRLDDDSSALAVQYVILTRQYETLTQLFAFAEGRQKQHRQGEAANQTAAKAMATLKRAPAPPAGSVQAALSRLTELLITNAPLAALREVVVGELTEADARVLRRAMGSMSGDLPRGAADPAGFMRDFLAAQAVYEQRPLAGFGELVTLRLKTPGFSAPSTTLMVKGPKGYQVRVDALPAIAAKMVEQLQLGRRDEAQELLRALVQLTPSAPSALKEERTGSEELGFVWGARLTLGVASPPPHVVRWFEAQAERADADPLVVELATDALQRAWAEAPEKRLALAARLEKSSAPQRQEMALNVTLRAWSDQGKFKESLSLVEKKLAASPRDRRLLDRKARLLPHLGQFEQSRTLSRQLAAELEPERQVTYLNNSAWWALFEKVDDAALQEIQRARELSNEPAYVNTAACVYAAAGKYDSAAKELQRMVLSASDLEDAELHPSYWFARGLVAEGFGRVETARDFYRRVKKEKQTSAADVWNLAQRRLEQLGKK